MADADVRAATPDDAGEIARIQLGTWRTAYTRILPAAVLDELSEDGAAAAWRDTIEHGPATVLVATEGKWTVGFTAAGPAPHAESADAAGTAPPDAGSVALVSTLLVEPRWGRRGHGGRLLAAAALAMRTAGATRGIAWIPVQDNASLSFYRRAGWSPDGTVRTLDAAGQPVRELRVTGELDLELA